MVGVRRGVISGEGREHVGGVTGAAESRGNGCRACFGGKVDELMFGDLAHGYAVG